MSIADEWTNYMWDIRTMEYDSAIIRSKDSCYNRDDLENILQSERSLSERLHIISSHWYEMSRIGKSIEAERGWVVAGVVEGSWWNMESES